MNKKVTKKGQFSFKKLEKDEKFNLIKEEMEKVKLKLMAYLDMGLFIKI